LKIDKPAGNMMQSRKVPTTLEKPGARKAKTACFKLINGVAIEQGAPIPRPPRQLLSKTAQRPAFGRTAIGAPSDDGPRAKWVTMCNQVLKFQAFFKEAVNESNMENYRTRMVNIMFYLSDQQLEITEVKTENSGIPQGQFLKKGKHNMAETDLIVGSTITLYGRTYYIVNCDNFTRQYCSEKGSSQPENQPTPTDAYNTSRSLMKERDTGADQTIARGKKQNPLKKFMEASLGNASPRMRVGTQSDNLSRFLENDRQVLRFYAQWDDTSTLYGQVHNYTINFFLANGQMEVLEINKPNEGRDHFPVFLQRSKVQRARSTTIDGAGVNGVEDEDDHASIFLTTDDLIVGDYVNIYGRLLLIHDADEFTYNQPIYDWGGSPCKQDRCSATTRAGTRSAPSSLQRIWRPTRQCRKLQTSCAKASEEGFPQGNGKCTKWQRHENASIQSTHGNDSPS